MAQNAYVRALVDQETHRTTETLIPASLGCPSPAFVSVQDGYRDKVQTGRRNIGSRGRPLLPRSPSFAPEMAGWERSLCPVVRWDPTDSARPPELAQRESLARLLTSHRFPLPRRLRVPLPL